MTTPEPLPQSELERIKALCGLPSDAPTIRNITNLDAIEEIINALPKCVAEIERLKGEVNGLLDKFLEINRKSLTKITRLQTELAEARKDKERLDGLIELAKFTQLTFSISFNGYADLQLQSGRCFSDFTNPRLLIDAAVAAMKATPQ